MAMKREYGQEQPYIPAGIFKIRLPFIHYRWEISECLQAILMCATCLGAIPVLEEVLGVPYEVSWSMVIINGFFYSMHALLGDPVVPGWITPAIPLVTAFLTLSEQGPARTQSLIALQLMVGIIFLFMGVTGLASKIIGAIMSTLSPFSIGFPGIGQFIAAIPTAISVYIIAFGDFVSSEQLLSAADEIRQDEKIDFNANRSNIISAIRNIVQSLICPYVALCGPLWAAVTASVAERYKDGRESMDSIFSGVGTFRWMTFICVALVPVASFVQPILPAALSLTLIVQGYVCCQIGLGMIKTDAERGIAGAMAGILAIKGAAWGLAAGVIVYILIYGNFKNPVVEEKASNA